MLFKIVYDDRPPEDVSYVTRHAVVHITADGRSTTKHLTTIERVWLLQLASCIGTIDKVTEPERKMFWLVFAPTLRNMGVIK